MSEKCRGRKRVNIVPVDGTIMIDGEAMFCAETMESLDLHTKIAHLIPEIKIHAVNYFDKHNYATITWELPEPTIISLEDFEKYFGHAIDAHDAHCEKCKREAEEHVKQDVKHTIRIAKHDESVGIARVDSAAWQEVHRLLREGTITQADIDDVKL
jgi:hypothetical protein